MLTDRQAQILNAIIHEYIDSALPVSSGRVFETDDFGISCPTIRNEMADLTDLGYLEQPHTSAGRVPTEKGYRFFVDSLLGNFEIDSDTKGESLRMKFESIEFLAEKISTELRSTVIFEDNNGELKYSGLKRAFENPEFSTRDNVVSLIDQIEQIDRSIKKVVKSLFSDELSIFIGSENPFLDSDNYAMISRLVDDNFISVLGPMRIDYERGIALFSKL